MFFYGCNSSEKKTEICNSLKIDIELNKGEYRIGEKCSGKIWFRNSVQREITIDDLKAVVVNISNPSDTTKYNIYLIDHIVIKQGEEETKKINILDEIPYYFGYGEYGIYISYKVSNKLISNSDTTFFRVVDSTQMLTCFNIKKERYKGLDVFKLDGGMSAEYVVEKAAENLTGGISHSWDVNAPGSGPNHVYATPEFLEKSVNYTLHFYNQNLGENTEFETVIISTGFPSIPYISNAMKAPLLPLHFLVSSKTVSEVADILEYSNKNNYASYATLSHDPSVPYAVAWVKLLDVPEPYLNFIKQHKVKNVVIIGSTGTQDGETKAKKILEEEQVKEGYNPGDIFIMFPGTSPDDKATLSEKITDLDKYTLQEEYVRIADWESGINVEQLNNFSNNIKSEATGTTIVKVTAKDLIQLYNLGSYVTLAYMHKNKETNGESNPVKGVVFNPYLLSHPVYEMKKGFIPIVYWQLIPPAWTLSRFENDISKFIKAYFPETNSNDLEYWLNSSRNFGGEWSATNLKKALEEKGYANIKTNDYTKDETWNPKDGMESISEIIAEEIVNEIKVESFTKWNKNLKPLTILELKQVIQTAGNITIEIPE